MNYIIMDLEWNNAYMKSAQKFVNEIIEIGAVKLEGETLTECGKLQNFVKPEFFPNHATSPLLPDHNMFPLANPILRLNCRQDCLHKQHDSFLPSNLEI